jgi:hypothetical protein
MMRCPACRIVQTIRAWCINCARVLGPEDRVR